MLVISKPGGPGKMSGLGYIQIGVMSTPIEEKSPWLCSSMSQTERFSLRLSSKSFRAANARHFLLQFLSAYQILR